MAIVQQPCIRFTASGILGKALEFRSSRAGQIVTKSKTTGTGLLGFPTPQQDNLPIVSAFYKTQFFWQPLAHAWKTLGQFQKKRMSAHSVFMREGMASFDQAQNPMFATRFNLSHQLEVNIGLQPMQQQTPDEQNQSFALYVGTSPQKLNRWASAVPMIDILHFTKPLIIDKDVLAFCEIRRHSAGETTSRSGIFTLSY